MAVAVIVLVVAACAMVVFSGYLVSMDFEEGETCCLHRKILRAMPLQAVKIVIVVWPILTQASHAFGIESVGFLSPKISVCKLYSALLLALFHQL